MIYGTECTREGEGGHSSGKLQHHKVWLQSHTLVPSLDLNQPAWELRFVQLQSKRINPWFMVPKEDRERLTTLDDPLLLCLLCHQSLGCARNAQQCVGRWDAVILGSKSSMGNATYTLFPFSGPRLAHWCWGKHKVLLSEHKGLIGVWWTLQIKSADCSYLFSFPFLLETLSFFPFCFSPSFYSVSLKWASVKPTSPNNYFDHWLSMDWILHLS